MIASVRDAEANVAYREERLERSKELGRPAHVARCEANLDQALWTLKHAIKSEAVAS
ncbi:hypothetical protein LVJ59_17700 [Microbacterium sp. KKR3/1]|uniref:hypothetical protein n=1 Tax=Microbacterium sp. KKR3/1 TaxID=2904241 RepID=UPI001E5A2F4A|nr:hypothetical protein [Microbacterium sp. KKR3/1]MCE0510885.1 hypothetical protein [Microbacterium sp. KKR3/1]